MNLDRDEFDAVLSKTFTQIMPSALYAVDFLSDFLAKNYEHILDGLKSPRLEEEQEAKALLQDLMAALTWPALRLVTHKVDSLSLIRRKNILLSHARRHPDSPLEVPYDALSGFAGLLVHQAQDTENNARAGRFRENSLVLSMARTVTQLGAGTPDLKLAIQKLEQLEDKAWTGVSRKAAAPAP